MDFGAPSRALRPGSGEFPRRPDRNAGGALDLDFAQHHLFNDAACGPLLFDALGAAYEARLSGGAPAWPRPAPRFLEQAEQARACGPSGGAADYWRKRLAVPARPPQLYARPSGAPKSETLLRSIHIDSARAERFAALAAAPSFAALSASQSNFNIFATLVAAWQARITGATQLALGAAAHGRASREARRTPGMFAELFPIETDLSPGESFRTLHTRLAEASGETWRHAAPGASSAEGHARSTSCST